MENELCPSFNQPMPRKCLGQRSKSLEETKASRCTGDQIARESPTSHQRALSLAGSCRWGDRRYRNPSGVELCGRSGGPFGQSRLLQYTSDCKSLQDENLVRKRFRLCISVEGLNGSVAIRCGFWPLGMVRVVRSYP